MKRAIQTFLFKDMKVVCLCFLRFIPFLTFSATSPFNWNFQRMHFVEHLCIVTDDALEPIQMSSFTQQLCGNITNCSLNSKIQKLFGCYRLFVQILDNLEHHQRRLSCSCMLLRRFCTAVQCCPYLCDVFVQGRGAKKKKK